MLNLTEKGSFALGEALKHFPTGTFTAKELSVKAGMEISASTLTAIVKKGWLIKHDGKPIKYEVAEITAEAVKNDEEKKGGDNKNLRKAKSAKNDEFYTQLSDIENELKNYRPHFKDKIVFCNCNDGLESNFLKFFTMQFETLKLKKLICFSFNKDGKGKKYVLEKDVNNNGYIDEKDIIETELEGSGGFDTKESLEVLEEADIVCTNPPFSLFREFLEFLLTYKKKFLVIGNNNAITYKEVFPLIRDGKMWLGYSSNKTMIFEMPDSYVGEVNPKTGKKEGKVPAISWFTNLEHAKRNEELYLTATFYDDKNRREAYPKYDNYDAIEVSKVVNIPCDYEGVMGVPITFLDKYCPTQFEIIGGFNGYKECDYENGLLCGEITEYIETKTGKVKTWRGPTIDKKTKYFRVLIRNRNPKKSQNGNGKKEKKKVTL